MRAHMRQVWISYRNLPDLENSITEYYSRNPHMGRHMQASASACVRVHVHVCVRVCLQAYVRMCVGTCVRMCAYEEISRRFLRFQNRILQFLFCKSHARIHAREIKKAPLLHEGSSEATKSNCKLDYQTSSMMNTRPFLKAATICPSSAKGTLAQ